MLAGKCFAKNICYGLSCLKFNFENSVNEEAENED